MKSLLIVILLSLVFLGLRMTSTSPDPLPVRMEPITTPNAYRFRVQGGYYYVYEGDNL